MIELQVLNYILKNKDYSIISANAFTKDNFPTYLEEFKFIQNHFEEYNTIPDLVTFIDKFSKFDNIEVNEPKEYLIRKLKEQYAYTQLVPFANQFTSLAQQDALKAIEFLNNNYQKFNQHIASSSIDIINETQQRFERYIERSRNFKNLYIPTGYLEIDNLIGGWDREGDIIVISARPGVGKTWALLQSALASAKAGLRVGVMSGEMSLTKVAYRVDTLATNISNWKINHGSLDIQNEYEEALKNLPKNIKGKLFIRTPDMFSGPVTVSQLKLFIEEDKLDIIFIDQYSLLYDERGAKDITSRFANLSVDIKNLQTLKKLPIVIVNQLGRGANQDGKDTDLRDLSGSDRIGQDASIVISIERKKEEKLTILYIIKNRDGEDGGKFTYYHDIDKGYFRYIPTENDANKGQQVEYIKEEYQENDKVDIEF